MHYLHHHITSLQLHHNSITVLHLVLILTWHLAQSLEQI